MSYFSLHTHVKKKIDPEVEAELRTRIQPKDIFKLHMWEVYDMSKPLGLLDFLLSFTMISIYLASFLFNSMMMGDRELLHKYWPTVYPGFWVWMICAMCIDGYIDKRKRKKEKRKFYKMFGLDPELKLSRKERRALVTGEYSSEVLDDETFEKLHEYVGDRPIGLHVHGVGYSGQIAFEYGTYKKAEIPDDITDPDERNFQEFLFVLANPR